MVKWLGDGVRGKIDWTLFLVTSEAGQAGDTLKSLSSPLSPGGRGGKEEKFGTRILCMNGSVALNHFVLARKGL
eukprot:scaffold11763_cov83-Skeletonema_marinoi.AAC.2